jgi:hypothetical protein
MNPTPNHQAPAPGFDALSWHQGVDLSCQLLPVDEAMVRSLELSDKEKLAASWALGLLAASAISAHEKILYDLKDVWLTNKAKRLYQRQAETFFEEEAEHARAYSRFIDLAADKFNLTPQELRSFLPEYKTNSVLTWIYRLEKALGGSAVWWTVAITEEESIHLFRRIAKLKDTDPLFYEINQLHFQEEVRHSSFSYKMLSLSGPWASRLSFLLSRGLQVYWLVQQLYRMRRVTQFADRHPMLASWSKIIQRISALSWKEKHQLIWRDTSYLVMMLNPRKHPRVQRQLKSGMILTLAREATR